MSAPFKGTRLDFRRIKRGRIAQLVEQLTLNQRVLGSSPSAPTNRYFLKSAIFLRPQPIPIVYRDGAKRFTISLSCMVSEFFFHNRRSTKFG